MKSISANSARRETVPIVTLVLQFGALLCVHIRLHNGLSTLSTKQIYNHHGNTSGCVCEAVSREIYIFQEEGKAHPECGGTVPGAGILDSTAVRQGAEHQPSSLFPHWGDQLPPAP